ncbi:Hypothetical protein ERGA_CDS_02570 [Ehrlichia ruminantium str. Gardel]|nr:Hypothetical protein ERGA_CDS_02570 [Ehrlichia ruminantium str. Gardel]
MIRRFIFKLDRYYTYLKSNYIFLYHITEFLCILRLHNFTSKHNFNSLTNNLYWYQYKFWKHSNNYSFLNYILLYLFKI